MTSPTPSHEQQQQQQHPTANFLSASDAAAVAPARASSPSYAPPFAPFAPFFTLVANAQTKAEHHPRVHYIFADDDPDVLTQALLARHPSSSGSAPENSDRAILVDIAAAPEHSNADPDYVVTGVSSLSPHWAVLDAQLQRASSPSSDTGADGEGDGEYKDRLILRVNGVDGLGGEAESGGGGGLGRASWSSRGSASAGVGAGGHGAEAENYAALADEFERHMRLLRRVVEASEERRRMVEEERAEAANEMEGYGVGQQHGDGTGDANLNAR